jgi:prevent-host-death family protein
MEQYSTVRARENFSEMINKAAYGKEAVYLTRRGKPVVVVIPVAEYDRLVSLDTKKGI